jgi:outer membrane protein insertion porin family
LSAGAGYSSLDKLVGNLSVQHTNLFGTSQKASVSWEFGARRQSYDVGWTDPWFMDKPTSFGVDVFDMDRRLIARAPYYDPVTRVVYSTMSVQDDTAYTYTRRGFSLSLGPRLTEHLSLSHIYTFERLRTHDINPFFSDHPDPNYQIVGRDDYKSSITNAIAYDTRDYYLDASRGGRHSLSLEVAGGPFKFGPPDKNLTFSDRKLPAPSISPHSGSSSLLFRAESASSGSMRVTTCRLNPPSGS